jgi:UDP-N-acetylmuramoyl-L-alanyl-D-glutamate--2,6-diaminopimelate ligase
VAIRPAHQQQRPLSALSSLLGVRLASVENSFGPNELGCVLGVTLDSRAVCAGDLYVALPGAKVHGAAFCDDAVAAGAVAVLTDPDGRARAAASGVPVFVLADPRARLGEIACWVYGDPSSRLRLIGVTGTSGKTTSSYLLESGLRAAGHLTGLVGGVEIRIGAERVTSSLTTPEAPDLQALFAVMAERGVTAAAMEVSSHSLSLGRVAGTSFDVAVFTNLSQDHLDFHADLEDYFRAKASLFVPPVIGVVNIDDRYGRRLASSAPVPVTTFSAAGRQEADWRAVDVRSGADGSTFRLIGPGGVEADVSVGLAGVFNVANALGALVALVEAGIGLDDAVAGVAACAGVPGRLERVPGAGAVGGVTAFVDYSHKPGAVEAVLRSLRPVTQGNLIIVLGCGGDRDRAKRPMMGAAAASLADVAILTSDNPRSEDPLAILAAMLDGVLSVPQEERARVIIEPDRAAAISQAVSLAASGDVIVVAGKGHETGQYVAGTVLPFDDRQVTAAALSQLAQGQPAQGQPARSQPARSQPARSQPARSQPARSQPAHSQPAQDQPAHDQPGPEALASALDPWAVNR